MTEKIIKARIPKRCLIAQLPYVQKLKNKHKNNPPSSAFKHK